MTRGPDVIVIGGGLHGCSTALHLALRRRRVLVIEKNTVGRHASGVNAGGVRRLNRHPAEIPLSQASLELWQGIKGLVGDSCGFSPTGQVKAAENPADLRILEERARLVRELGYSHEELVDRSEMRRLVPAISPHIVGGLVCREDGFANPYRTVSAFRRKAQSLGVEFRENTRVTGLDRRADKWTVVTAEDRFDAPFLVNCAGAWADRIAGRLGEPVPLEPVGLMMIVTARVAHFNDPVVGLASRQLSFKQTEFGSVLIGGALRTAADRDRETTRLDFATLARTARTVAEVFPSLRDVPVVRCWAGIEAYLPDEIPVIGASRTNPGVFHAFGFSGHGFQLGPIVGRILADLVTENATALPIGPFGIERFARDGASRAGRDTAPSRQAKSGGSA